MYEKDSDFIDKSSNIIKNVKIISLIIILFSIFLGIFNRVFFKFAGTIFLLESIFLFIWFFKKGKVVKFCNWYSHNIEIYSKLEDKNIFYLYISTYLIIGITLFIIGLII